MQDRMSLVIPSIVKTERDMIMFTRQAVIPVWVVAVGLVFAFASSSWLARSVLILVALGLSGPLAAIALWMWRTPRSIPVPALQTIDITATTTGGSRQRRGARRPDEGRR